MADDTPSKEPSERVSDTVSGSNDSEAADTDRSKRKRRVLRPAAEPATLREQTEQAQAKSSRPRWGSRQGRILAMPFVWLGHLLARIFRPLGKFRYFRVLGFIIVPPYIRNAWKELRQVTWPDRRQSRRLTFAVVIFSLIFGCIVAVVDTGLDKLFRALVLK